MLTADRPERGFRMIRLRLPWLGLLLLAVTAVAQDCPQPVLPQLVPGQNMFSPQQEVWLGDAEAAWLQQELTLIHDAQLTAYLQTIVDRLAQNLPPDHVPFHVNLIEAPTADAFGIAGGQIYVSRKIFAVTMSEDEVAALLAHEMGHMALHHDAIRQSAAFRQVLGVNAVGDRADIVSKWNQLLSNWNREKVSRGGYEKAFDIEERQQVQADTIALYLLSRAGYSPQALVSFFDRLADTKGKTGGFWSDFFKTTSPDSKRLRQLIANQAAMPAACISTHTQDAGDFENWKKEVIEYSIGSAAHHEAVPGLLGKVALKQRLRPQIEYIRISPNGQYVLAQDDSNIYVLTRDPFRSLFRFDAPEATSVQFSPDSQTILVLFSPMGASPRVERWNIATQKRVEAYEIYVRDGCLISGLSPDGNMLLCLSAPDELSLSLDLVLYDVKTGTSFWKKKNWDVLNLTRVWIVKGGGGRPLIHGMVQFAFSPDGHYLVAHGRDNTVCLDLTSRTPMSLPGSIQNLLKFEFTFLADGRFFGIAGNNGEKSEVVEFPGGQVVAGGLLTGISTVAPVAHGDHLLLRPIKDSPLGVFDIKTNRIVLGSKISPMDLWDGTYIAERDDGDLQIFDLATIKGIAQSALPEGNLGTIRAAALSPDLKWLAISQTSRGAVWDLQSNQRLYHLRGFASAYVTPDGTMYADFPKHLKTDRMIVRASLVKPDIQTQKTIEEENVGHTIQTGRFLLTVRPNDEARPDSGETFELRKITDNSLVWTKQTAHWGPHADVDASADSFVVRWSASQAEHELGKTDPHVAAQLASFKKKDGVQYVQVFTLSTGELRGSLPLDTGKYSFRVEDATSTRDRLVVSDNEGRVLVYSLDGELKGTIAGNSPSVSMAGNLMTVRPESGKLELYDLETMRQLNSYDFGTRIAFDGFSGDGTRLLVLTADQVVYTFNTSPKAGSAVASK